jgi:acetyl/propionyl-CoA carboxylase alpha subunit
MAKLIVHGGDRAEAVRRLGDALRHCEVRGVANTLSLHRQIVGDAGFAAGGMRTSFLDEFLAAAAGAAA